MNAFSVRRGRAATSAASTQSASYRKKFRRQCNPEVKISTIFVFYGQQAIGKRTPSCYARTSRDGRLPADPAPA